jgi:anthranilate/para-aminobenzoate synthase component I
MKGTARRGLTLADDRRRRDELHESTKQRAENVMIVDMVRNDLGRIAQIASVEVPELFTVEQYPNVWQMTSLVTGDGRWRRWRRYSLRCIRRRRSPGRQRSERWPS